MNTTTNKIRFSVIGIVLGAVCIAPVAMGADFIIHKSWVPETNERLTADDLNGNFQAAKTAIDDNNLRSNQNETDIISLENSNDGDWTVSGNNVYSAVSGNVGIGDLTPTSKLDVNGTVSGSTFQYRATETRYLQLAGGQCIYPSGTPSGFLRDVFLCMLGNGGGLVTAPAYWAVNVPNGATLLGMRIRLFTAVATTTCTLRSGTDLNGTEIASVVETAVSGVTNTWHFASETTPFTHDVDNASNAYGIVCENNDTGGAANTGIGSIRIQYTVPGPD